MQNIDVQLPNAAAHRVTRVSAIEDATDSGLRTRDARSLQSLCYRALRVPSLYELLKHVF